MNQTTNKTTDRTNLSLFQELQQRGLIHQVTDPGLEAKLSAPVGTAGGLTAYAGFDATADGLHVGHLLGIVNLKRLHDAGHSVIVLLGGATGCIGDPSGKSAERQLLGREQIDLNAAAIHQEVVRLIDVQSPRVKILNNINWFESIDLLTFLRDIGKHFTVHYMLAKDSVQSRMNDRDTGISYTEFSYMLLQSYDFLHLHQKFGCNLQLGGSDQWGNITAGIELIRRKLAHGDSAQPSLPAEEASKVYGLTWPLVTKADGTKFGKTESGTIWLSPHKTKPYDFYQYFLRTQDRDVIKFLNYYTFLSLEEIQRLAGQVEKCPEKREAQQVLAKELTTWIHGEEEFRKVHEASQALFVRADADSAAELSPEALQGLINGSPTTPGDRSQLEAGLDLVDLLVLTNLTSSKGQARKDIQGGGIYLNLKREDSVARRVGVADLVQGKYLLLRKGKKNYHTVIF